MKDVLIAAAYTPFTSDLEVDYRQVAHQLDYLLSTGVKGVLIGGTTGEGVSLTMQERMQLVETWKKIVPNDFKLVVHVGHNAYKESNELALHAQKIGADSILGSTPTYFRPTSSTELVSFFQHSLKGINLPFYYYHIPSVTGVSLSMVELLSDMKEKVKTFRGIKFTHEDLDEFEQCSNSHSGQYDMVFGRDEMLLEAVQRGARTATGSTYNYMASLYTEMLSAYRNGQGEIANELQAEAVRIIKILNDFGGGIVAGKAMMQLAGVDCGPVRPPLTSLTPFKTEQMTEALSQTRFFEFTNQQPIKPNIS